MDPPDPMPNSVVKRNSADGSVGPPHVRVGHRQALNFTFSFMLEVRKLDIYLNYGYRMWCYRY